MTQPAKAQEPSMEEILASIRRIIADDEAKPADVKVADVRPIEAKPVDQPPVNAKPVAAKADAPKPESVRPEVMNSDAAKPEPSKVTPARPNVAAAASPLRPVPVARPQAVASQGHGGIDTMRSGIDNANAASDMRASLPDGDVFELTDDMALPDPQPNPFRKVDPQDDLEFSDSASRHRQSSGHARSPDHDLAAQIAPNILSRSTVSAVESAFNSLANTVLSNNARTLEDLVKEMLRPMLKTWLDDNLPNVVERIVKAEIERVSRGR